MNLFSFGQHTYPQHPQQKDHSINNSRKDDGMKDIFIGRILVQCHRQEGDPYDINGINKHRSGKNEESGLFKIFSECYNERYKQDNDAHRIAPFDDAREVAAFYEQFHRGLSFMRNYCRIITQTIHQGAALSRDQMGDVIGRIGTIFRHMQIKGVQESECQIGSQEKNDKAKDRSIFFQQLFQERELIGKHQDMKISRKKSGAHPQK